MVRVRLVVPIFITALCVLLGVRPAAGQTDSSNFFVDLAWARRDFEFAKRSCQTFSRDQAAFNPQCSTDDAGTGFEVGGGVQYKFNQRVGIEVRVGYFRTDGVSYEHTATASAPGQTIQLFNRGELEISGENISAGPFVRLGPTTIKVPTGLYHSRTLARLQDRLLRNFTQVAGETTEHEGSAWSPTIGVSASVPVFRRLSATLGYEYSKLKDIARIQNNARAPAESDQHTLYATLRVTLFEMAFREK